MYKVKTNDLVPGMILAEDLFSIDQNIIATKGTHVTHYLIQYLKCYGVFSVYVRTLYPED
ncbi:MAG TPA: hypothetical protein PLZ77_00705 [Lachnospiraceae bacterium]|nr:hypothetical protein [Lachnospiraceae bacterium]HPF28604.1 hypothetical protein [Lachnospiraceae bacterium]